MTTFFAALEAEFPQIKREEYELFIPICELEVVLNSLSEKHGFVSLCDLICIDQLSSKNCFVLIYRLSNMRSCAHLDVIVEVDEHMIVPSLGSLWKNSKGLELEVQDLFGIQFSRVTSGRIFNHYKFIGHPLRKDFTPSSFDYLSHSDIGFNRPGSRLNDRPESEWINIGPYHAATDSGMRLMAQLSGEKIINLNVEVGLTHKGIEKRFEQLSFKQLVVSSHQMDITYPETYNILLADCIESFFGIDIPERAKVLRIFILELERITTHLDCLSKLSRFLKGEKLAASCSQTREVLQELNSKIFGLRSSGGAIRFGGVTDIFKNISIFELFEYLKQLKSLISSSRDLFYSLDSWMHDLGDMTLSSKSAIEWGITGPALRASGINWDLRKRNPHYFYNDLVFSVPCGVKGNSYDRYVVRIEEMFQSLSILEQLLDYIPSGSPIADLSSVSFEKVGRGSSFLEGPNGVISVTMEFGGKDIPERVKIRPSTFPMCLALEELLVGKELSDSLQGVLSLNIVPCEIDR
ncbi:MAG: NADH-quinone oxidoreductase subunit C [Bacteriovoracaceae bacterium]|nr:NADH-quinone oxidoreductase subunit C [Bacteriovoracaceae bacterium]